MAVAGQPGVKYHDSTQMCINESVLSGRVFRSQNAAVASLKSNLLIGLMYRLVTQCSQLLSTVSMWICQYVVGYCGCNAMINTVCLEGCGLDGMTDSDRQL